MGLSCLACAGLVVGLAAGNYLLALKVFAPFEKQVMVGSIVAMALVMHFFGPTVAEMDEQVDARIARKKLRQKSQ